MGEELTSMARGLTLWQPWATLMALLVKWIETRSWGTSYRGPVLLQAAARRPRDMVDVILGDYVTLPLDEGFANEFGLFRGFGHWHAAQLPLGAVVAVGNLVDCLPITEPGIMRRKPQCLAPPAFPAMGTMRRWTVESDSWRSDRVDDQFPYGDFTPGRFGWIFDNVRPLTRPVPAKGKQGLWRPSVDLLAKVASVTP